MPKSYRGNAERVSAMSNTMKEIAAKAMAEGHPLLKEAGLEVDAPADHLDASPAQLESLGTGSAQLEAIVRITNRPPLLVRNNTVELEGIELPGFANDTKTRIRNVEPMIGSVGRIEFINADMDWGGTGWVIAKDGPNHLLVVTNRHVAKLVARRNSFGSGTFLFDPFGGGRLGAAIDFNEEVGAPEDLARVARIEKFTFIAEDAAADVAIGRIRLPEGFDVDPLTLSEAEGQDEERIAVVGYPASDDRNDFTAMERYFRGLYNVKRFSPGFLRVRPGATRLTHDATTLGGNSGSPVISLDSGKVVGLHFAGRYAVGNSAVRVGTLKAILNGDTSSISVPQMPGEGAETRNDGDHEVDFFEGREGYNPGFLDGLEIPLPDVSEVPHVSLAKPSDATTARPHELRYQHFGVLYSTTYRSAVVAAANIDGGKPFPIKRGRDRWFFDKRIDKAAQIGSHAYGDAGVDRGHMVKRETPNWGEDGDIALLGNNDTFHLTNCSPQHGRFNRNTSTWRGIEDYLIQNARMHGFKACIFTGPILSEDLDQIEEIGMFLPREYWKVGVMPVLNEETGEVRPHATAYLLSQGQLIQQLLIDREESESTEGFAFGEYKTFQIPIAALEKMSGINFGALRDFDPMAGAHEEATQRPYRTLDYLEDVIL